MYTRQQGNSQLISTEDPEDLVRRAQKDQYGYPSSTTRSEEQPTAGPYDNLPQDPVNNQQRDHSDSKDENGPPPRNIPILYVPDLANTILSEAILDGIQVGNSGRKFIIHTPRLKDIMGIERLKVTLPTGELETCSEPTTELRHQMSTNTLQPPATERSTEGHEERQPRLTVPTR